MKIFVFLISIVFCCSGFACDQKSVLFGEVILGGKKPEVIFKEINKKWNVNSDEFDNLYLKSSTQPKSIKLLINDKVVEKKINATKSKRAGFFIIKGLSFQKDLSDGGFKYPFKIKLEFTDSEKKICSQEVEFQVVQ